MRSYLLSTPSPNQIDLAHCLPPIIVDEEKLEAELSRAVLPHIRWEEGLRVESGDMVTCRMDSSLPRFHKDQVKFIVGSRMFQPKLEQASLGMKQGEKRRVSLAEGEVEMTVLDIRHRVVPPLNDEMVRALGIEGVETTADYRAFLSRKQRRELAQELSEGPENFLTREVIDGSAFVLYREDWLEMIKMHMDRVRVLFRHEGKVLEQALPEDFKGRIPVQSFHELEAMVQREAWDSLCLYLLGKHYAREDGFCPTAADHEKYIREYQKTWRVTEQEALETDPYPAWEINEYICHAADRFRTIVLAKLLEDRQ